MDHIESLLRRAAQDPLVRLQFYEELLDAKIFIISDHSALEIEDGVVQQGTKVSIARWSKEDGTPIIPFFSSLENLQKAIKRETPYIQFVCKDFFQIIRGQAAVLNPSSEIYKEFAIEEIESLLDGTLLQPTQVIQAERGTKVMIGEPAVYPEALVQMLKKHFKSDNRVKKAYLVQYYNPAEDEEPHSLMMLECDKEYQEVIGKAYLVAQASLQDGEFIDFLEYQANNQLCQQIAKDYQPFYRKKFLGIF